MDIIRCVQHGEKKSGVTATFKISRSTLSTILKNKLTVKDQARERPNANSKRIGKRAYDKLEKAFYQWFLYIRFTGGTGWLQRFKDRYSILGKVVAGESVSFENVELCFLPPNATAVLQPPDQGIIRAFKQAYRVGQLLVKLCVGGELKIDLLAAIQMLSSAWCEVTRDTIRNCFRHAGLGLGSGVSLSMIGSSQLQVNPDIPESHALIGWYSNEGASLQTQSLSVRTGGFEGAAASWKHLSEAKSQKLGFGDKPDYFSCKASVAIVRKENCLYKACPAEKCNKKLVNLENGLYRCEKCNEQTSEFKWRLIVSDESRLKTSVVSINPVNYVDYTKKLLKDIAEFEKVL
ncbi:replication factor A 1, rfa1, putative [Ixodes scapularis]|uniref:Replication factor A 1, rfa1, putative n=1 Tax=Ixodes scapularis TaxID=6945 RepID=B7Q0Q8_IXOSC|nr:replication factor A 1, rfa1, putative [Ixodes scapularis]|eukprot:XP_002408205.1 replication factor A 1, rfa1, putative [Ixodes scapularis]